MAKISINIDDAKSFLSLLANNRAQLLQEVHRVKNSFESNCDAWQGESRIAFENSLTELLTSLEHFVNASEEDIGRLQRIIAASEEIAECRFNF